MRVALTGASGFIGQNIARHLAEAGHTVTALVRPSSQRDAITPHVDRFVVGPQDDASVWPDLLDGADAIVHNAFDWKVLKAGDAAGHLRSNVLASIELMQEAGSRHFVYMSSIAVHHDMRPRWDGVVDEDHPTRPAGLYGAAKAAIEAHCWARFFTDQQPFTALRPCAVYGQDPAPERTIGHPIVHRIKEQQQFKRLGGGKFVHVDDVAALTVAAVGNEAAFGRVYNVVDCYARWCDLAAMVADILGIDADIDNSSPVAPKNEFTKDAMKELGIVPDRGQDGLRAHLRELIDRMSVSP